MGKNKIYFNAGFKFFDITGWTFDRNIWYEWWKEVALMGGKKSQYDDTFIYKWKDNGEDLVLS